MPGMARFEDLRHSFWDTGNDHGVRPALTDRMVEEAERLLKVRLPAPLLDLLRIRNGGQVDDSRAAFPTSRPTSWSSDHVPFDSLMGLGHRERTLSMLDSPYLVEEWGLPTAVVLLSGGGHYWIGLDYRTCGPHGEPSVTWFDADDGSDLALAPDFRSFTEGLTSADAFEDGEGDDVTD